MNTLIRNVAAVALMGGGLAACGGDSTSAPPPPPVVMPPAQVPLEDTFGVAFGTAYRASPNTDATDPAANAINPLTLTAEATTI